jgi:hypothetical protein
MKGIIPLFVLVGGFLLLRNVRKGVDNLEINPVDFKINNQKSNITKLVTDLKIEVTNPDKLSGTINEMFFTIRNSSGVILSTFEREAPIKFNASRFYIDVQTQFNTGRIVAEIIQYFGSGQTGYPVTIEGWIDTNLGRFNFIDNIVLQ